MMVVTDVSTVLGNVCLERPSMRVAVRRHVPNVLREHSLPQRDVRGSTIV